MKRSASTDRFQPLTSENSHKGFEVTADLYCYTIQIVNVVFYGKPGSEDWVLIDTGMPKTGPKIIEVAAERFGKGVPPKAIILTHGHFDHIGGLIDVLEEWRNVPVYAHELEMPFITGRQNYPEPDTGVEGGMVAKMSFMFPVEAIDIGERAHMLPPDHTVPFMPGWEWLHTPGHSEGHVSLFRASDQALIAGDAFVTVKQDSLYKVFTQELEMNGPPRYLTPDWESAEQSVKSLAILQPKLAITGHGVPVTETAWLEDELSRLANNFQELAVPDHGKFVDE
ncbi:MULTISPECIES: MBL fold metallo-hydrolase [unclassified Sporosarcina]|uniref:MBL fold metallo-hydrolase n=1 Tax=unclassified Sporosarcina TaxID=2647733 RepID=UPI00203D0658|nr:MULTISPECIES: MBL fold metallo-hydrolase [unclassified Sporosarcina]GKV66398.1 MBL fold metallo-hydrolase [Sporosarcina sp. NCCP-2331]GLB56737.1 MBL fold metallo-hydrolase [Sporosarcina sp. NCCP-2378]